MENKVLDIIIAFIKGCKDKDLRIVENKEKYFGICNSYYLLGQIIRNYFLNYDHYYISEKAISKWNSISNEPIFKYWYRDNVIMEKNGPVKIIKFVGNSKNGKEIEINKNNKFIFRDVFHDEHIVPIKMIVDELLSLEKPNYDNVQKILDKIYICRMLKDEDRSIKSKFNRSTDINEVIKNDYKNIKMRRLEDWNQIFK